MPLRLCSNLRCNRPVHYKGRCAIHASRRNAETRSHNKPTYSSAKWKNTRSRFLFENPLCDVCGDIATDVHHRVDLQAGGAPFDWANLQQLCHPCHSQISRQRQIESSREEQAHA